MADIAEILEDDLILVCSTAIMYASFTGDSGAVEALTRIAHVMAVEQEVRVTFQRGQRMDPNVDARMRMAEEVLGIGGSNG